MGLMQDIARRLWGTTPQPTPAIVKTKTRGETKKADNARLVPVAGRLFVDNQDNGQDMEFELSYSLADNQNGWGQRQDNLTAEDIEQLERRGISGNQEKAAELKALWAGGMSAADITRFYHGRYGYGERTIKSYVAAFNAALPGGGAATNLSAK